jgi:cytochrome c oxidase assembly protein subunit 15
MTESSSVVRKPVRIWLWTIAALVFCMVLVGGATRLTDSGLSITEWQPILGAIPPLTHADWLEAFEKYKQIPEYQTVNRGMTLTEFEFIYWWEWAHRFLGRIIGIAFLVPFLIFIALRQIDRKSFWRLLVLFLLGGAQGALGWYMVQSGLVNRVDVSQYRLAAHLTLATILYAAIIWTVLGLGLRRQWQPHKGSAGAGLLILLLFLQIGAGGFVAGLDAGMGYNTWPKMDGQWIPQGLWVMEPVWRNLFENAMTVQFLHRILAYIVITVAVVHAWRTFSMSAMILVYVLLIQAGLGILTLLLQVPLALALAHQGGALVALAVAVWHLHRKTLVTENEQATVVQPISSALVQGRR